MRDVMRIKILAETTMSVSVRRESDAFTVSPGFPLSKLGSVRGTG
jgi:hypothetical protein